MFSEQHIQSAFRLAYILHPDRSRKVPLRVLYDAYEMLESVEKVQSRRGNNRFVKTKIGIPDRWVLQIAVYWASEKWERDQEGFSHRLKPCFDPTREDLQVRYIKLLISRSILVNSFHVAYGLGCRIYQYQRERICELAPDFFNSDNKGIVGIFDSIVNNRFGAIPPAIAWPSPDAGTKELVLESLLAFTPWGTEHAPATGSLLPTYFSRFGANQNPMRSQILEEKRIHFLIDHDCAGLRRLIQEYNQTQTGSDPQPLPPPEENIKVPSFAGCNNRNTNGSNGGGNRFNPDPLSGDAIMILESLYEHLKKNRRRRKRWQMGNLRILADGHQVAQFDASEKPRITLEVPAYASHIDVWAEQDDGEDILLAVFPMLGLDSEDDDQPWTFLVELEGGQKLELTTQPLVEAGERSFERSVQLTCTPRPDAKRSAAAALLDLLANAQEIGRLYARKPALAGVRKADSRPIVGVRQPLGTVPAILILSKDGLNIQADVELIEEPVITPDGRLVMRVRIPEWTVKTTFGPRQIFNLNLVVGPEATVVGPGWPLRTGQEILLNCPLPSDLRYECRNLRDWDQYPFRFILVPNA